MWHVWLLPVGVIVTAVVLSLPVGLYLAGVLDGRSRRHRFGPLCRLCGAGERTMGRQT